ncbi:hypothetical protein MYIN104542_28910 [Mycobacterium intermedium]
MPDLDCDGTRLYEALRSGRFLLVKNNCLVFVGCRVCTAI